MIGLLRTRLPFLRSGVTRRAFSDAPIPPGYVDSGASLQKDIGIGLVVGTLFGAVWIVWAHSDLAKIPAFYDKREKALKAKA